MQFVQRVTSNPSWPKIVRYVPSIGWLAQYDRTWLRPDLIAGMTLWGVGVPSALAYAQMAGVSPVAGLYAAFCGLFFYSLLATSRHLKVTASSTMAVMSASLVGAVALPNSAAYFTASAALALIVGVMLLLAGIARLGVIADFLSKPVVTGFVFGLAISIIIGQLPKLLGYKSGGGNSFQQLYSLLANLGQTNWLTLTLGVASLVLIFGMRRFYPKIPGALVALVAGIVLVKVFHLDEYGVAVVGPVATGFPTPTVPWVSLDVFLSLFVGAVGIVFLAVGESIGTARAFAVRNHYPLDADQELIAMGVANMSSGLLQGFTVDASLSTTATSDAAGAKSQLSSLVAAGMIILTAAFLANLFSDLPDAVLGAIVIASVVKLIDYKEMARYSPRAARGLLAGLPGRRRRIVCHRAGRSPGGGRHVARSHHLPDTPARGSLPWDSRPTVKPLPIFSSFRNVRQVPGVLIVRLNGPVYFYNVNQLSADVLAAVTAVGEDLDAVVIDLRATARRGYLQQ